MPRSTTTVTALSPSAICSSPPRPLRPFLTSFTPGPAHFWASRRSVQKDQTSKPCMSAKRRHQVIFSCWWDTITSYALTVPRELRRVLCECNSIVAGGGDSPCWQGKLSKAPRESDRRTRQPALILIKSSSDHIHTGFELQHQHILLWRNTKQPPQTTPMY